MSVSAQKITSYSDKSLILAALHFIKRHTAWMAECLDSGYSVLYTVTTFGSTEFLIAAFQTVFMARLCMAKHCRETGHDFFLLQLKQTPFLLQFLCFQMLNAPPIFLFLLLAPLLLQRGTCNCFHKTSCN